jgi:hypothetical protein
MPLLKGLICGRFFGPMVRATCHAIIGSYGKQSDDFLQAVRAFRANPWIRRQTATA